MSRTARSAAQFTMFDEVAPQRELFDAADGETALPPPPRKLPSTKEDHLELMREVLAMLAACDACPWNAWEVQLNRGLFKNRSEWQEPALAAELMAAFAHEAERLDFANAPPEPEDWDD